MSYFFHLQIGLVKKILTLNYDGLLQKAGCTQDGLIEMYGSWFDPSNPPVKFGGTIRKDLLLSSFEEAERMDLCIVIGSSLRY